MKSIPTNEQINKVAEIAGTLGIDFPQSSKDFTKKKYQAFIDKYQKDYDLFCENANSTYEEIVRQAIEVGIKI